MPLSFGFSSARLPTTGLLAFSILIATVSLVGSSLYHRKKRKRLAGALEEAQAQLRYLEEKLLDSNEEHNNNGKGKKEIRIFMEGAFDMMHFGHMNAFRLARSLGTHLIVGVNSDESISECKGPPLMDANQRLTMVQSCKFVDQVVPNTPYIMSAEYLDWVIKEYNIDYVIHGDDPCIVDGRDVYKTAKAAGKFRTIPRTTGVSTTDIVGRMLLLTKEHHCYNDNDKESSDGDNTKKTDTTAPTTSKLARTNSQELMLGHQSRFLTTSRMLQLFTSGVKAPTETMRIIYIDGAWDLFHPGHVAMLEKARERGDYLLVGVHGDSLVNKMQGMNLPLMNLHERVLSVLGCRFVDDVLIDAPLEITPELIKSFNIAEVVRGMDGSYASAFEEMRYKHAKKAGIFTTIKYPTNFRISSVIQRIQKNQETFQAKFERKMEAELNYVANGVSNQSN